MEKFINLRFHHQGEFQSTQYAGGKVYDMKGIELDTFSYAVLMEYVKDDLRYSEIGGIYVSKDEMGGWKLLSTDSDLSPLVERVDSGDYIDFYVDNVVDNNIEPMKQMQPHVVIRPRHSLLAAKKQVKRKFVTTHQLQQQQKNKKTMELGKTVTRSTQKLPQGGSRKSPRLNNQHEISDATASHKSATARRKLDLDNPSHEDENTGENDVEACYLPPPPALTEYENQRAVRIKMNNEVYFALNLPTLSSKLRNSAQRNKGKEKMQEGSEDYDPGQEDGSEGDAVESPLKRTKNKKKVDKKKVLMGRGPTTRSRGNDASKKPANEDGSKKQETRGPVQLAEFAEPCIELPKSDEGNGSMAAFWAMRKRQKEKDEKEKAEKVAATATESKMVVEDPISPNIEGGEAVEVPKRLRGKTRMEKVHTRSLDKRIVVPVNELFQPIADDDRVRTELGNFLGTLAKRCVSLTYVTWRHVPENLKKTMWNYVKHRYIIPDECEKWVEKTIQASWRRYKSTIKKAHYKAFENDEERLENRPEEIPLESFKMLLEYWNDETIQSKARTNSASRKNYVDTHTAGPKSFAQIRNKMTKEMKEKLKEKMKEQSATSDAEDCDADVCDAQVFVETRKRTDGRKYQANPAIMKSKIEKIKKKLSSGDAYDELVSDGKSHDPTWLLGRCPKPSKDSSSCAPTDTYVQQLTNRIRQSLADEVEEKMTKKVQAEVYEQVNKKVQQNLAWILKKLGEANPNITVDIDQLGAIISSDNDDVTPMTGGTSF